jgi:putative ABC transport system permease protein
MNRSEVSGRRSHGYPSSGALGPVWLASIRDLQWRSRRFLLAVLATGLVFGVALMISGVANSFNVEVKNTVGALGARFWFVPTGSLGPFTVAAPFPASDGAAIRRIPGVTAANPIPVVDESLGVKVGQEIALNGIRFKVNGLVNGVTYFAGQPVVFVTLRAADALTADGKALATAVLVRGMPIGSTSGFTALTDAQVRADLGRPTAQAAETIRLIEYLLWLVAAGIIGAIVYLSALERRGDFAVLKAVGTPSWHLFFGLVFQAVLIALGAAIVGILVEIPMSGTSQMAVRLAPSNYLAVPLVAVIIGVVASIPPARRAAGVDPAIAFGRGK